VQLPAIWRARSTGVFGDGDVVVGVNYDANVDMAGKH
jgi:hypothetical protein